MDTYRYYRYYRLDNGMPLVRCPDCGGDLTEEGGIDIDLYIEGAGNVTAPSCLDETGALVDTADGAVDKGFHSGTHCGHCGELLINMDVVDEVEETAGTLG